MRIGHCQLESKTGDFEVNLDKVVKGLERADKDRVEIVCFPECFLTGYPDKEEVVRKSAFAVDSPQMMKLLDKTGRFEATYIVGLQRGPRPGPVQHRGGRPQGPHPGHVQQVLRVHAVPQAGARVPGVRAGRGEVRRHHLLPTAATSSRPASSR